MSSQRLMAFISSRMEELAPEREIIKIELKNLHVDAWEFEIDAGARPQSIQQTYLKVVETADLYIGIFWLGYGEYTIEEFDHAVKLGKSCLVYEKRTNIEARDPRLTAFLEKIGKVEGLVTIKWFETSEDLGEFVKRDVAAWQTEIIRNALPRGYAAPFQAPALSDKYVERPAMTDQLRETLLALDENGEPRVTRAALHGMGGSGKTVIASAFAHLDDVRKRFPDGVLYTTLGQTPDIKQRLSDWGHALHDPELPATGYIDPPSGTNRLRTLLNDKACLLIVDDVWEGDHARAFVVGGPRCLLLITTRISEIGEGIEASTIELAKMTHREALKLVETRSGPVAEGDREHADWLMKEVEYLPLALELISAQVKKLGWEDYRRRWSSQKLKALKRGRESRGKYDNLWDSLELSVAELSNEDQDRYLRLGVFQEDTSFPAGACARLWECSDDEAAEILVDFAGRALLREQKEFRPRLYSFHDLFYEFVVDQLGSERRKEAHRTLVASYRSLCNGEWHKLPDDGYVFDHLAEHLQAAGFIDELYKLVTRDWMEAQFHRVHSHRAFAADLGRVCAVAQAETPANLFRLVQATVVSATLGSLATRSDPEALAALAHIGEVDAALGYAELIHEPAKKSRAYRLIAAALIGRGESPTIQRVLQEALKAAQSVKRSHLKCPALCDLAVTIFDAGDIEWAREVGFDAESVARSGTSDHYRVRLLLRAALTQARIGNTVQSNALALHALSMVDGENQQDPVQQMTYLVSLEAVFEKSGNDQMAQEIKAKWEVIFEDVNNKVKTDGNVYLGYADQLSAAFLEIGEAESAAIIAERWTTQSWEAAGALARAANALVQSGDIEQGTRLAEAAVEYVRSKLGQETYPHQADERISSLGSVTEVLGRIGRPDVAILLAEATPDADGKSHSLGTLALALAQCNSADSARRAANASMAASKQLIQDTEKQAAWLSAIARALNKIGKKTEAMEFGKGAQSLAENFAADGWRFRRNVMPVAETLTRLGENASALSLINRIEDLNAKVEGWVLIIRSPAATSEQRVELANRVIDSVRDLKDASKPILLGRTARALAYVGLDEEAIRLARLAVSAAATIDDLTRAPLEGWSGAAHAFIKTGLFEQARDAITKVTGTPSENPAYVMKLRVHALSALARALEDVGQHDEATATAYSAQQSIGQDDMTGFEARSFHSEAWIEIAKTFTHMGNAEAARKANRQALDLALDRLKKMGA